MLRTRICDILGTKYPIVQAVMAHVTSPELVAAVSNAGALGTLGINPSRGPGSEDPTEVKRWLQRKVRETKELTDKPFAIGVNIGSGPGRAFSDAHVEVAIEEKVAAAIVTTGGPEAYTKVLQSHGVKVLHAISNTRHAIKCEALGVDAVVTESFEAGGHSGFDELTTFVLVPQVRDATSLPVIAGGGIVDPRTFAAALVLGADGVYVGTRFLATKESAALPAFKQAVVDAEDAGTVSWGRKIFVERSLKNRFTQEYLRRESSGASKEELQEFIKGRVQMGYLLDDKENGDMSMSANSGLIRDIRPAADVVKWFVEGAAETLERLPDAFRRVER